MKIIYSRLALKDLQEIRAYYAGKSPQALHNISSDILKTIHNIPQSIFSGRATVVDTVWERITPKYHYIIPYTIVDENLWILRVYDARR